MPARVATPTPTGAPTPLPVPTAVTPVAAAPAYAAVLQPDLPYRGRANWAIWAGGATLAGLTAIAGGVAIGYTVSSYRGHVAGNAQCGRSPYDNVCSPLGVELRQQVARDTQVASVAATAVGPLLISALMTLSLAAGNWLAVTEPTSAVQVIPVLGPAPGVALRGAF